MRTFKRISFIMLVVILLIAAAIVIFLLTGGVKDDWDSPEYRMNVVSSQPVRTEKDFVPAGNIPVSQAPFERDLRSVSLDDLAAMGKNNGIYDGSPKTKKKWDWYQKPENYYGTLASRKVWKEGHSPLNHERRADGDPINWTFVNLPIPVPNPCDQPQKTGYDAEGCRIVNALFKDVEAEDPAKAAQYRKQVRRGRDVWFKGSFGMQDEEELHLSRTLGSRDRSGRENWDYSEWLDTRERGNRFTKWGLINDPDCVQGNEESFWLDICQDPNSTGVLGYRKYFREPIKGENGDIEFNPATSPYEEGERQKNKRFYYAQACVQCHVAFDPTNPPENPNEPKWENLTGHIGNQYTRQPMTYLMGTPQNHFGRQVIMAGRLGTIDTSLVANDFQHNPGTQNNITDFMNKRTFMHEMKHPITGEVKTAPTFHVLKGGEDNVGDWLALIRVYVNIGLCTEECWVPKFPVPGSFIGDSAKQKPFDIKQCSADCEPWNDADAKMPDLAAYLMVGGPYQLAKAKDVDGTDGMQYIDTSLVPKGRKIFIQNCARCHSSKVPNNAAMNSPEALDDFYKGHAFGAEATWELEFAAQEKTAENFVQTATGLRPQQFVDAEEKFGKAMFGQDWLGNDELTPYHVVGTNRCRAMHDNHDRGHIWDQFSSETFKNYPVAGKEPKVLNRLLPELGGTEIGKKDIGGGGPGYYRNISLLSIWSHAPFLHNNAVGELTTLPDGTYDYTVKGRIEQFEKAMNELLTPSDKREPKISTFEHDLTLATREDGQGPFYLTVKAGTPVNAVASQDPHNPLFMKCSDLVENKGHDFGVDLSIEDKKALTEFLKLM